MANIPIYNDGRMPGVPQQAPMAMVPVASYHADYAGLARSALQAYAQPLMPKDMYEGDQLAAQAWGEAARDMSKGMMDLGEAMVKVEKAAAKAKDYADLEEGRTKIQDEAAAHEEFRLGNLNPLEWVRDLDKHVGNVVKWLAGGERSPRVQAQLHRDVRKMRDQGELQHSFDWAALTVRRAGEAHARKVQGAVALESIPDLEEAIQEGVDLEIIAPPMAKAVYEHHRQEIYASQRARMVKDAPDAVLKYAMNPEAEDLPPEFAGLGQATWGELRLKARESMYGHQRGLMEDFREAVRSSTVRDDADAEVWTEMHVPEGMQDATLRPLMQRLLHGEGVDMAEVNRIRGAIGAHDPKGPDSKMQRERLRLLHMQFPREIQEELDGMLDARVKSGRPESMVMQAGRAFIQRLHRDEMLPNAEGRILTYKGGADLPEEEAALLEDKRMESAQVARHLEDELEEVVLKGGNMTETEMKQWVAGRILPTVLRRGAAAVLERFVIPKGHKRTPAPGGALGWLQGALSKR